MPKPVKPDSNNNRRSVDDSTSSSTTDSTSEAAEAAGKPVVSGIDAGKATEAAPEVSQQQVASEESPDNQLSVREGRSELDIANKSQAAVIPSSEALLLQYAIQGGSSEIITALLEAGGWVQPVIDKLPIRLASSWTCSMHGAVQVACCRIPS